MDQLQLLDEEFLQPLGVSQYRLTKAIDVPASRICATGGQHSCCIPGWPGLTKIAKRLEYSMQGIQNVGGLSGHCLRGVVG